MICGDVYGGVYGDAYELCDESGPTDSSTSVDDAIAATLGGPKSATVDGVSVTQHSLPELIAAAKYLAAQKGAKQPHRGLRFTKLVPPGA